MGYVTCDNSMVEMEDEMTEQQTKELRDLFETFVDFDDSVALLDADWDEAEEIWDEWMTAHILAGMEA